MSALIPFGDHGHLLELREDDSCGEFCLCRWSPPRWQRGDPTTDLPPGSPKGRRHQRRERVR